MAFIDELTQAGLLISTGEKGLYGKNQVFESIVSALDENITRLGVDQNAEVMRFPPAMTFTDFKASGYMGTLPQLAGTVHCFCGNEREHKQLLKCIAENDDSWTDKQQVSNLVITPAACYPVYPVVARRGVLPEKGVVVDAASYCFRHEPSIDPMRMQFFRMHEYIKIGTPNQILSFRDEWIHRGKAFISMLDLPLSIDVANDPFFGRGGVIMANSQREQQLKYELLIPVDDPLKPSACMSFNYHMDHFGELWNIKTSNGALAHTACVGFGMERITLALLKHHGFDIKQWPDNVLFALWPSKAKMLAFA